MPRCCRLNASGLNAAEYDLFTSSLESVLLIAGIPIEYLKDGDSDDHYDNVEVKAQIVWDWFQSRYNHISAPIMEKIFKCCVTDMNMDETVFGWDFFAMLRLVIHIENGMMFKRALIFEQTKPSYASLFAQKKRKHPTTAPTVESTNDPAATPATLVEEQSGADDDDDDDEEGPLQKKVKLREVAVEDRVALAHDNPLRCVRCIRKNIECRINPAHIPALLMWKNKTEWTTRPRHTACLHCDSWAKSCRLPGMKVKPQDGDEWREVVLESLERIEASVDKISGQRSEESTTSLHSVAPE